MNLCDIIVIDLSRCLGHVSIAIDSEIGRKWSIHEIHFSMNIYFFASMRTTDEEFDTFLRHAHDRDIILSYLRHLILVVVVLDSGFDDGFEYEEIHSVVCFGN